MSKLEPIHPADLKLPELGRREIDYPKEAARAIVTGKSSLLGRIIAGHSGSKKHREELEREAKSLLSRMTDWFKLDEDSHKDKDGNASVKYCSKEDGKTLFERKKIKDENGNLLDTFVASSPAQPPKAFIINFNGSGGRWQGNPFGTIKLAREINADIIDFNYPGVGESTGTPLNQDTLVKAGLAQVRAILDSGVKPEQIVLKGFSLGSAVATLVAAELKKEGKEVNLFHDRSFSSITSLAAGHAGKSAQPLVRSVLRSTGWEMDVTSAWLSLSEDKKKLVYTPDDKIITDQGSLHRKLEKYKRDGRATVSIDTGTELNVTDPSTLAYNHVVALANMVDRKTERRGEEIFRDFVTERVPAYRELSVSTTVGLAGKTVPTIKVPSSPVLETSTTPDPTTPSSPKTEVIKAEPVTLGSTGPRRVTRPVPAAPPLHPLELEAPVEMPEPLALSTAEAVKHAVTSSSSGPRRTVRPLPATTRSDLPTPPPSPKTDIKAAVLEASETLTSYGKTGPTKGVRKVTGPVSGPAL